jgi:hypothetical protein
VVVVDDMGYAGVGGLLSVTQTKPITITLVDRPLVIAMPTTFRFVLCGHRCVVAIMAGNNSHICF